MSHLNKIILTLCLISLFGLNLTYSQDFLESATMQGNLYSEAHYYFSDVDIGADTIPEYVRANIYGNIYYRYNGFTAGVRYEAYQPPIIGYDHRYEGQGIAHRFISYTDTLYEVTIGNFYEQFGSGIILRTYEDKNLGIDNAFDGLSLVARPMDGLTLKGLIGKQRSFWEVGPGTVRGIDAEWSFLHLFLPETTVNLTFGGSAVSRLQDTRHSHYVLPQNVAAFSGRSSLYWGGFFGSAEYAWKINDPMATNNYIYKNGQALVLTSSYSTKGLGILLTGKYIDNMDFRSDRYATENDLMINYLPATTRQHAYSFPGMYPYASQPNGEVGAMAQINYLIPKQSKLGGKYGTNIQLNASIANSIDKQQIHDTLALGTPGTLGYNSKFGKVGDEKYYHDISLEINRRITRRLRIIAGTANQYYNKPAIEGDNPDYEEIKTWVLYADATYRLANFKSIKIEGQHLQTKQDKGNWAMLSIEYAIAPNWSFSIADEYNYGNENKDQRKHYYLLNIGYNKGAHRLALSYGKRRAGVQCIGGVCRIVPASYSAGLIFSTTF